MVKTKNHYRNNLKSLLCGGLLLSNSKHVVIGVMLVPLLLVFW